ncbi:hypothetical protein BU14_0166s0027 [Porphyra umbilicalis]|uniref:Sulfhydryl oxidase n=1 Tax=Porphyra umbilicalis TaxID=2786 RepID=A0A1X6P841_PORUM|nr:hypothetical protein BU14_0166s0027 [Porphyra umbilicalis]|eukprot:OSX76987.1 hypothetical protein BU14_0166s0027 [Porphyra umbilicalis]
MRRAVAGAGLAGLLLLVGIVLVAAPWAAPWSAAARLGAAAVVEAGGVSQAAATAAVARDSVAVPPPPPPTTALRAPTTTVAGVNASAVEKKAELGRAGWTLIHTTAATLPTPLTPAARDGVVALLRAVAQTYPCKECREHFASFIAVHPIDIESRDSILQWTCIAHNAVNARQHKPAYPCGDIKALDARWGDCGCDRGPGAAKA